MLRHSSSDGEEVCFVAPNESLSEDQKTCFEYQMKIWSYDPWLQEDQELNEELWLKMKERY